MNLNISLQNFLARHLRRLSAVDYFLILSFAVLFAVVLSTVPTLISSLSHSDSIEPGISKLASKQSYSELQRYETDLKKYEHELKLRSEMIGTILKEAEILEYDAIPKRLDEMSKSPATGKKNFLKDLGIGGGDEHIAPLIIDRSSKVKKLNKKEPEQISLLERLDFQLDQLRKVPLGTPVNGRISSGFGYRYSPFSGKQHKHSGLDIAVESHTPVYTTADGVVLAANYKGAYGNAIVIDHENGIQTLYGHLSKINVTIGDRVCKGQKIGFVGSTGRSTGPHLHYEVHVDGKEKDPEKFVQLASFLQLVGVEQAEPEEL
jgi:murein DD-endopeptidase MepM/ murein hydrolase activator NlpD